VCFFFLTEFALPEPLKKYNPLNLQNHQLKILVIYIPCVQKRSTMLGDDYMITHGLNTIPYCSAVRTELVCSSRDCSSHTEILLHSDFYCNFTRAALTYATIDEGIVQA